MGKGLGDQCPGDLQTLKLPIEDSKGMDPFLGPKLCSKLALDLLLEELKTTRGTHAETLMAVTGQLVGQSIQASLWEEAQQEGLSQIPGVKVVCCHDHSRFFIGEPLNRRFLEGCASPWSVLCEVATQEGCRDLPDATSLLLDGLRRLGTPNLGMPQVADIHKPQSQDPDIQKERLLRLEALCRCCCHEPSDWPLLSSLLAVRALRQVKGYISPAVAFRLAVDSAIDAGKIPLFEDPRSP